jgi:hypothetical protein
VAARAEAAGASRQLDHDGSCYDVHGHLLLMNNPQPPSPIIIGALNEQMLGTPSAPNSMPPWPRRPPRDRSGVDLSLRSP